MTMIKKLAELREKDAISRDIPRKWVMTDSFIIKAAFCKLNDLDELIEISDDFTALVGGKISEPRKMSELKLKVIGEMMSGISND